jgi:hypothetical protein
MLPNRTFDTMKTIQTAIHSPTQNKSSSWLAFGLAFAAIVTLNSCGNNIQLGDVSDLRRGGRQRLPQQRVGYNNLGQQHQGGTQQTIPHLVAGQRLSLEVFGNQPKHPTPGCRRDLWENVFGKVGPMINDKGSFALVEHVPTGLTVLTDGPFTWKADCGNRVLLANRPPQPRIQIQGRVEYRQRIMEQPYCPQPRQMMAPPLCPPIPYCPPRQPRLVFVPYSQQQQLWCQPQYGGGYGRYPQRPGRRH